MHKHQINCKYQKSHQPPKLSSVNTLQKLPLIWWDYITPWNKYKGSWKVGWCHGYGSIFLRYYFPVCQTLNWPEWDWIFDKIENVYNILTSNEYVWLPYCVFDFWFFMCKIIYVYLFIMHYHPLSFFQKYYVIFYNNKSPLKVSWENKKQTVALQNLLS